MKKKNIHFFSSLQPQLGCHVGYNILEREQGIWFCTYLGWTLHHVDGSWARSDIQMGESWSWRCQVRNISAKVPSPLYIYICVCVCVYVYIYTLYTYIYTLPGHFIRCTLLVPGWTPFCLQNCLNSSWHRFNKVLETFLRDFGPYWHDNITQLLQICRLHIHNTSLPFHHILKVLYWIEIWWLWRPFE